MPSITFCTQELLEVTVEAVRMKKIAYDQNEYKQIVTVSVYLQRSFWIKHYGLVTERNYSGI